MKNSAKISEIIGSVPGINSFIDAKRLISIDESKDCGFSSSNVYFDFIRAVTEVKFAIASLKNVQKSSIRKVPDKLFGINKRHEKYIKVLASLDSMLDEIYRNKLELSKALPNQSIQIKLIQKLELNDIEIAILNFILSGSNDKTYCPFYNTFTVGEIACNLSLSPEETLYLLSKENKLLKHHIYEVSNINVEKSQITDKQIKISVENLKVLLGFNLTADEFFKIKGTVIEDIIEHKPVLDDNQDDDNLKTTFVSSVKHESLLTNEEIASLFDTSDKPKIESMPEETSIESNNSISEYSNNIDYLKDQLELLSNLINLTKIINGGEEIEMRQGINRETKIRELKARNNMLTNRCNHRLELTLKTGNFVPKLLEICNIYNLCEFEKNIILYLVGGSMFLSQQIFDSRPNVRDILGSICQTFEEQISSRRYFYKSSNLIKSSVISVSGNFFDDINHCRLELDRSILDEIVGLDFEIGEMAEGSSLYTPVTSMDDVVIEESQKREIIDAVKNFEKFKEVVSKNNNNSGTNYQGNGMILMFYGPSGTGKTMMANAIANFLKKKLLLINYPNLGHHADSFLRLIFRESKINNSIIFFDEAEGIFGDRIYNENLSVVLSEIERHENIVIMATNRAQVIDEAMHRRIKAAFYFDKPTFDLREKIWSSHIPPNICVSSEVDLKSLAYNFELTGGLIKNSIDCAINFAISRDSDKIILTQTDLEKGARTQLKGHLKISNFEKKITPVAGLESIIVDEKTLKILKEIVASEKAKQYLFGKWGFDEGPARYSHGTSILFYGEPGVGKTFAAEAIGYEMGQPIMRVNIAQMVSKWVGETSRNIEAMFAEAQNSNAILLCDEADSLFTRRTAVVSSTDKYSNMDVNVLLTSIESYHGIVILTTNFKDNMDSALFRRIRYTVKFEKPSFAERMKLWKKLLPEKSNISSDVNFEKLAKYDISGGHIKNAIFRAATKAILADGSEKIIIHQNLEEAAEEELSSISPASNKIGFELAA